MAVHILESFTKGKTPHGNDDTFVALPHVTAVIDGVTGPEGTAAMETVKATLETMPAEATERDFADAIAHAMQARFGAPKPNTRMAGATAAIYSHARNEVWIYGDPQVVFFHSSGQVDRVLPEIFADQPIYAFRRFVNELALLSGELASPDNLYDTDPGRDALAAVFNRQHVLANRENHPDAYSVLCAKPVPAGLALVVPVAPGVQDILLTSDGYPLHLMADADLKSLDSMEAALKAINARDPHCMKENLGPKGLTRDPTTGQLNDNYDDRTVLRFRLA